MITVSHNSGFHDIKPLLYNLYNLMFLSVIGKLLPQIAESFVQSVKNIKSDLDLTTYLYSII